MAKMSKEEAVEWLVDNVKVWPVDLYIDKPPQHKWCSWGVNRVDKFIYFFVISGEFESSRITEGEWAAEAQRVNRLAQAERNKKYARGLVEKGMFRWSGPIPNNDEAKEKMAALAAKLRDKAK